MRKSYRFRSSKVKLNAVKNILSNGDFSNIGYLRLRSKCKLNSETCSEEYSNLYDLWEYLECNQLPNCTLDVSISKRSKNNKELHCIGHNLLIKNGKVKMSQRLV